MSVLHVCSVDVTGIVTGIGTAAEASPWVSGGVYWLSPRVAELAAEARARGTDRLRTCLMATHTDEDIERALTAFERAGKRLGLI